MQIQSYGLGTATAAVQDDSAAPNPTSLIGIYLRLRAALRHEILLVTEFYMAMSKEPGAFDSARAVHVVDILEGNAALERVIATLPI